MLRLTLRTLLAYLDDTLSPAESRDIAQQIAEEPAINDLITRIKHVVRRRKLLADQPDVDHADIDPNDVAEYLDSMLPGHRVAELEVKILDKDQSLAEVASVHQILSLVLGKPLELPASAKERAYRLVKGRTHAHAEVAPVGPKRMGISTGSSDSNAPYTKIESPPTTGRVGTALAVLALIVMLAAAVSLTISNPKERPLPPAPLEDAVAQNTPAPESASPAESAPTAGAPTPGAPATGETAAEPASPTPAEERPAEAIVPPAPSPDPSVVAESESKSAEDIPLPKEPLDAIPELDATMPRPQSAELTESVEPAKVPTEGTTNVATEDAPTEETTPPAPAEAEIPATEVAALPKETPAEERRSIERSIPVGTYVSPTGVLLRRRDGVWSRIKSQTFLFAGEDVAFPEPGRAKLEFPSGAELELVGPTRLSLSMDEDADVSLLLDRGRLVFSSGKEPVRVMVRTNDFGGTLLLMDSPSQVAVELTRVPSAERANVGYVAKLRLIALTGALELNTGEESVTLRSGQGIELRPDLSTIAPPAEVSAPAWTSDKVDSAVERKLNKVSDEVPLTDGSILRYRELLVDGDKEIRSLAVLALGVADQVDALVEGIGEPKYGPVRVGCLMELREMVRRGEGTRREVQAGLARKYRPENASILMELIVGPVPAEARKVATYRRWIQLLESPELPIREGAIMNLRDAVGRDLGYSADAASTQRKTPTGRWQKWLETMTDDTLPAPPAQ